MPPNNLLLIPTQLFSNIDYLKKNGIKKVWLYEEPKFFTHHKYHKLKLLYHRITCKYYLEWLKAKNITCEYIDFNKSLSAKITHIVDPIDHELLKKYKKKYPQVIVLTSQHFTLTPEEVHTYSENFYSEKTDRFSHEKFYKWQRRRLDILVNKNGDPEGGKWSFDKENRKPIPKSEIIPPLPKQSSKSELELAKKYIEHNFGNNYGEMNMVYPTSHEAAHSWLTDFVNKRLKNFGKYEDASQSEEAFLYHSVLTPMLNIGFLTDWDVIKKVLQRKDTPLASLEGFLRQVIGWRNYMYCIYILKPEINKLNFFGGTRRLDEEKWWTGTTGIGPIDDIIKNKIVKYAYTHHIERLMYLGSFMLMLGIQPDDIYKIFMEWTIDAYDWVMVPNIYGMSQFADGGKVMRRPYISSSNYIKKMSNYTSSVPASIHKSWRTQWDALYYAFIWRHHKYFSKNYYYAVQVKNYISKSASEKREINKVATELIAFLTKKN